MTRAESRALDEGQPSRRPSRRLIVGLVVAGLCALVSLGFDVVNGGAVNFTIALALAMAPVPLLLAAVLALDRLEPEPRGNLIFAFAWGAGIAVLVAGLLNTLGLLYLVKEVDLNPTQARSLAATFGAPVVEETLKGLVLLGMLRFRRQELDGPTDGIIYASMVGLGFAMSENVGYYASALNTGAADLAVTVVLRGLLSPFAHPLFTSLIGIAVAYAAQRHGPIRIWVIAAGWAGAMILHGLWNGLASYAGYVGLITAYLILMVIFVLLIAIVIAERRRLLRLIARYMPAYQGTGLVGSVDLFMLSSLRARREARQWARAHGGVAAARAMGDYQQAATELVLLHQRLERKVVDPPGFSVQQSGLLHAMAVARAAFPNVA
ncbi:PrsW family intramembrane metalloprotease [Rhizohabitans arisaemae]|uniref:PrsW family intramembrane metalloprotease n=1 Tax=Rhizohabitans arisaemae TaxID=2720610 RepID=UPI0024B055C4|nr:PrsW family intramembrane metalloprotease [Rhizohabitans arisaemae]